MSAASGLAQAPVPVALSPRGSSGSSHWLQGGARPALPTVAFLCQGKSLRPADVASCPRTGGLLLAQGQQRAGAARGRRTAPFFVPKAKTTAAGEAAVGESSAPAATPPTPPPKAPIPQEKDVRVSQLTSDTWTLRGRCSERFKFEIEYGLKRGTTDNAYLIRGPRGAALLDVPDAAFADAFVRALEGAAPGGAAAVRFVVLGHLSPRRAETLAALARARPPSAPPVLLKCSNPAAKTLEAALPPEVLAAHFQVEPVRAGDTLDLGDGHELRFILTPTPRWPDGMCTYDPATQLLYTHKLFSAHICTEDDFDVGGWGVYGNHWRFFYDCMLAPVATQASNAIAKLPITAQFSRPSYEGRRGLGVIKADLGFMWNSVLGALKLDLGRAAALARTSGAAFGAAPDGALVAAALCPLHGPIVRSSLPELVREYKQWTDEKLKQAAEATVAVIFASAYGNTSALAQAISRGVLKAGVGVEAVNCEHSSADDVAAIVKRSAGFAIGSPTLAGHMPTPVQEALGVILGDLESREKPCGVFGSFGWSGEAVDELEQRLKDGGFPFAFPPIRCKFKPTESMLQVCEESGTDLGQVVKKARQRQRAKDTEGSQVAASASSVEQAVGRVVGSLCVVSAKSGDAESAMLASWVSQASFNPPGVTVAVAKERAVEGILLQGGQFVLNVLGQQKAAAVSKQLLKPFKPGEARLGALETTPAGNGAAILKDAIAHLECQVATRMDAGDHIVLYATVTGGDLQNDKDVTAVHYRKTGARY